MNMNDDEETNTRQLNMIRDLVSETKDMNYGRVSRWQGWDEFCFQCNGRAFAAVYACACAKK